MSREDLIKAVIHAAIVLEKDVFDLTKQDIISTNEGVTKYQLTREFDTFYDLLSAARPSADTVSVNSTPEQNSGDAQGVITDAAERFQHKDYNRKMRALSEREGQLATIGSIIRDSILEAYKKYPAFSPAKSAFKGPPADPNAEYEILAVMSDTHFGLDTKKHELPANPYNWERAARRMGRFAESIANFHPEHRKQTPQLRLCVAGDICQGAIHLDDHGQALIGEQLYRANHILSHFVDYLLLKFNKIVIEYTSDNHMRRPHKGPGRGTAQKWDSYAYDLIFMLAQRYVSTDRVQFVPNMTPYSQFEVLGHKYLMTHGDTFFTPGNVGGKIDTQRLIHQFNKLRTQSQYQGTKVLITGHVHTQAYISPCKDTYILVNGTGSGADLYAQSLSFEDTNIVQTLAEVSKKHPVGDYRMVELYEADNEPRYNSIIPTPPSGPDMLLPPTIIHKKE